tara:strand:+ start:199 stop:342 length:144 start_codon:yes stop_codon:yes gene_type:complete
MDYSISEFPLSCRLPRREKAKEALYCLIWKKVKSERPEWILEELNDI